MGVVFESIIITTPSTVFDACMKWAKANGSVICWQLKNSNTTRSHVSAEDAYAGTVDKTLLLLNQGLKMTVTHEKGLLEGVEYPKMLWERPWLSVTLLSCKTFRSA